MESSLLSTKDIVKYLIVAGLIYSILKMIPSQQIANKDLILIMVIITVSFVSIDCMFFKKDNSEGFANEEENDPFALDLDLDIEALLKKKAELQTKNSAEEVKSERPRPRSRSRPGPNPSPRLRPRAEAERTRPRSRAQVEAERTRPRAQVERPRPGAEVEVEAERYRPRVQVERPRSRPRVEVEAERTRPGAEVEAERTRPGAEVEAEIDDIESGNGFGSEIIRDNAESIDIPEREETKTEPKIGCALEVEKIKRQLEDEIDALKEQLQANTVQPGSNGKIANKYFESLISDLVEKGLLDSNDIENIRVKMRSKLLTMEEIISSLETLKKEGKSRVRRVDGKVKDDKVYNELPSDFYSPLGDKIANEWDNEYTILNTNKWQVPMPRPPVCINTTPCKVCPSDSSSYPVNLKQWDDSRYVTSNKINKKWAQDQSDA